MSTSTIRVLHVVNSLCPGGMENGVVNIANGLQPRGFETHVACLERSGAFADRLPNPEFVYVLGKNAGFSMTALRALMTLISRLKPNIIHTHNMGPLIYGALASFWGLRVPMIHGEHSHLTDEERKPKRIMQRKILYSACRCVHSVAINVTEELQALGLRARRMESIVNGVDTTRFSPGDRRSVRQHFNLPVDAVVIGLVGRFGPYKGHDIALSAFARIAEKNENVWMVFAGGGGSQEARVRELAAKSRFSNRIVLTGFLENPVPAYQALDLLIIPSSNEGLSNAALEGMACGVPILGNPNCGHEHLLKDGVTGWIRDIRSAESLAAEVTRRLADPEELHNTGKMALQHVQTCFTLKKMVERYESEYCSSV